MFVVVVVVVSAIHLSHRFPTPQKGTDEASVNKVLGTRSTAQLLSIAQTYSLLYKRDLLEASVL